MGIDNKESDTEIDCNFDSTTTSQKLKEKYI